MTFGVIDGDDGATNCFVECFGMWLSGAFGGSFISCCWLMFQSLTNHPDLSCFPLSRVPFDIRLDPLVPGGVLSWLYKE